MPVAPVEPPWKINQITALVCRACKRVKYGTARKHAVSKMQMLLHIHQRPVTTTRTTSQRLRSAILPCSAPSQTRRIDSEQRMAFAQIIVALNEIRKHEGVLPHGTTLLNVGAVASAMRNAGFATRDNGDDEMMAQYARLFFDSDEEGETQGFTIPQEYFVSLMDVSPLVAIPDSAIFVGRTSLMFRGLGSAIGSGQIRTATRWHKHAEV